MASYNKVIIVGNLTRDPELKNTTGGTSVADLGIAINDNYKNKAGETVEQTTFVDVVVWGRQAETANEFLSKGSSVLIEGKLQLDQWDAEDGSKRSKMRVRADRVQFLSTKSQSTGGRPSSVHDEKPNKDVPADFGDDDDDIPF